MEGWKRGLRKRRSGRAVWLRGMLELREALTAPVEWEPLFPLDLHHQGDVYNDFRCTRRLEAAHWLLREGVPLGCGVIVLHRTPASLLGGPFQRMPDLSQFERVHWLWENVEAGRLWHDLGVWV